jgi:hypothetical protein
MSNRVLGVAPPFAVLCRGMGGDERADGLGVALRLC